MSSKTTIVCMLLLMTALAGCTADAVDDTHPFAGEWTGLGGSPMVFIETSAGGCDTTWDADLGIAVNTIDCTGAGVGKTVMTWNYTFVSEVLFMQTTQTSVTDSDGNTTTTNVSNVTLCAAYVPRDIAPDEASWKAEVNAVTWPSYCTEIVGL